MHNRTLPAEEEIIKCAIKPPLSTGFYQPKPINTEDHDYSEPSIAAAVLGKTHLTPPNTSVSTRPWDIWYSVHLLHSSVPACGSVAPVLNVLTVVITVITSKMWFSSGVWISMHSYIYIVIGWLVFITTLNEFEFQIPVIIVELLPLKASVEIWCFCQGSVEADVKEFDEEFKSPLSGWGVSRDFLPSKLWRLTPAPLITHCSPGLRLMNKKRD